MQRRGVFFFFGLWSHCDITIFLPPQHITWSQPSIKFPQLRYLYDDALDLNSIYTYESETMQLKKYFHQYIFFCYQLLDITVDPIWIPGDPLWGHNTKVENHRSMWTSGCKDTCVCIGPKQFGKCCIIFILFSPLLYSVVAFLKEVFKNIFAFHWALINGKILPWKCENVISRVKLC